MAAIDQQTGKIFQKCFCHNRKKLIQEQSELLITKRNGNGKGVIKNVIVLDYKLQTVS